MIVPIFNAGTNGPLAWDQAAGGWDGTYNGTSLLVTLVSPPSNLLPWNEVANSTGLAQESSSIFNQATDPSASYPFIDLGILPTGTTAVGTYDFHYTWGPGGSGVPNWDTEFATIAPNPVPEPSSLVLMLTGAAGLLGIFRKKRRVSLST